MGKVFYQKFRTKDELENLHFVADEIVIVEGILRLVNGYRILTKIRRSSEEF